MSPSPSAPVDLEAFVDEIRSDPSRRGELVSLLHEGHPVYDGRGEATAVRMRGWVMAAFKTLGLPPDALPAVCETLETGTDPFAVAAAARAASGAPVPSPVLCRALVTALVGIRGRDDRVSFAELRPTAPTPEDVTALTEVLRTLRSFGAAAHVVHAELAEVRDVHAPDWNATVRSELDAAIVATARVPLSVADLSDLAAPTASPGGEQGEGLDLDRVLTVLLEDQDGVLTTFGQHFIGRRHVVAFFYTRCGNPAKCSATVSRLGELARALPSALPAEVVGVVGISYDPGYDNADRLAAYGAARGVEFSGSVRLMRAPDDQALLRHYFDLRVGYVGTLVNQHAIELYLLDADARVEHVWTRTRWSVDDVLAVLSPNAS